MKRRIALIAAVALCLLGCGSAVQTQDRVKLQTSGTEILDADGNPVVSCILMGVVGELIVDLSFGTALKSGPDDISPVIWPWGFTGRRVGSEIEVLDREGKAVARTGRSYEIFYTNIGFGSEPGEVLAACGEVRNL